MEESTTADLGWLIAKLDIEKNTGELKGLTIVSPADSDEGVFTPAQSVRIWGEANIRKLRDFLNGHLLVRDLKEKDEEIPF